MEYDVVKSHAISAIRSYKKDSKKYQDSMTKFYSAGKENPSVANIILQHNVNQHVSAMRDLSNSIVLSDAMNTHNIGRMNTGLFYATQAIQDGINTMEIPNDKSLNSLAAKQEYDKVYNELYPKTGKIRKMIAESGHLKIGKVSPKMTWEEKVMNTTSISDLKKIYPKSINARIRLFTDGQIEQNTVTPKVKGFFNRLTYKFLIKDGFSFAKKVIK